MNAKTPLLAGATKRVVNCEIGDTLSGQFKPRVCEYIRDDLEANIVYLASGDQRVILANLDHLGVFSPDFMTKCTNAMASNAKVPIDNIMIFSTHTHAGPYAWDVGGNTINTAHLAKVLDALASGAQEAVAKAVPAQAASAVGNALIGPNRRVCWSDGSHTMYGDTGRADFVGFEGPNDPSQAVLALAGDNGVPIAVVHNNCAHSTCVGSGNFASADFAGEARRQIRTAWSSPSLPVLYMQGASGDTCPHATNRAPKLSPEELLVKSGTLLAQETLRLLENARHVDAPVLNIRSSVFEAPVRLPTPDMLEEARAVLAKGGERGMKESRADGQLRVYAEFKDDPVERPTLHALQVGDFVAAFLPGELYCQFGLDIKRRSPFPVTAVVQLTGPYRCGYIPTTYGFIGGGYSADLAYSCRSQMATGYRMVDEISGLLRSISRSSPLRRDTQGRIFAGGEPSPEA
ncbi:MAG: hypothetical protein KAI66_12615 [Lentisphaeria bacterium]|nr:hypothetical protein [Lentisphaeria bacterium]